MSAVAAPPLADLLRGAPYPGRYGAPYPRLTRTAAASVPLETVAASLVPAGLRAALRADTSALRVDCRYREARDPLYEWAEPIVALWLGDELIATARVAPGRVVTSLPVPARARGEVVHLHLPMHLRPEVEGIASVDGTLEPAHSLPRWVAYGDSITAGWSAPTPGAEWVARVGRTVGLDVVNLGFAGAAHGERAVARDVARLPAAVVTIAFGTNCWRRPPHTTRQVSSSLREFFETVRGAQPDVPIVVLSPLLRPDAETQPNSLGATHSELREGLEETVSALIAAGAAGLTLVQGRDLLGPDHLVDGLHPGEAGHARLAEVMADALRKAMGTP